MKELFLIIYLMNGSVIKETLVADPHLDCFNAFRQIARINEESSKVFYKNKTVYAYYCKDKEGKYVG